MPEVSRTSDGNVIVELEAAESQLLRGLLDEYRDLLASADPLDPVAQRLFPRAFDDDDDQRSWQSLVGGDLLQHKRALASADVADRLELDESSAMTWLALLTDLRLAIGTRLGVTEEMMAAALDPDDPNVHAMAALHWLGWLQELLIENVS